MIAAVLPWLAGCWWLQPQPGPADWRLRAGTIGDFRPHHVATLYESAGSGKLLMECGQGPIVFRIGSGRDRPYRDFSGLPVRYRLDGNMPVATTAGSDSRDLWFRDPARESIGDDPMVSQIEGARQLAVRIDWSSTDRQVMRFDVSRTGAATEWLRRKCADAARRFGATT